MKQQKSLFIFATLFYLAGVIAYTCVSYQHGKKKALQQVDKSLESIALTADFFLSGFHNKNLVHGAIPDEEYTEVNQKLNTLNAYFDSAYIYSFIKKEDTILFTTSSYTNDDKEANRTSKFLDRYNDATEMLKEIFTTQERIYEEAVDEWGYFRSILIPMTSQSNQTYVIGVDIEISYIQRMLMKQLATTTFTGLFFLLLVVPFCILYIINLKTEKIYLETEVNKKTKELRLSNETLNTKNTELSVLSSKLSKYLAPQVYENLFSGKMDVKIETKRKDISICFSDIKDFTKLAQDLPPKELTIILNLYIENMTEIATAYGATIDKFIGDAIMVFFGDPISEGAQKDAVKCVKMAIAMQSRIKELRSQPPFTSLSQILQVRIGISSGTCTVGNFGCPNRMDYTIIGNDVNLASRLEPLAEPNGILISESTYELVKNDINCTPNGEMRVKGFEQPIKTFKAIDAISS